MGYEKIVKRVSVASLAISFAAAMAFQSTVTAVTNSHLLLSSGNQTNIGNGGFEVTPDQKFIVFTSAHTDVVSNDTNGHSDIFVRDTKAQTTERVSISTNGTQADNYSNTAVISNNGRYIAFDSYASNLATMGTKPTYAAYGRSIFIRDRKLGTTETVKTGYSSGFGNAYYSVRGISEDARFIYYEAMEDAYSNKRFFVQDRKLGTSILISKADDGTPATNGYANISSLHSSSCDGRWAAFMSNASNLVPDDNNNHYDVFLADTMNTHEVKNITLGANADSSILSISCDGNYVLFNSSASNIVTEDTNNLPDVFLYSIANETTERVSLGTNGAQLNTESGGASISADGRYVAYENYNNNNVPNAPNEYQVYVYDRDTSETKLVSKNANSQIGDRSSVSSKISLDGKSVIFMSQSSNFDVTNSNGDWYIYKVEDF